MAKNVCICHANIDLKYPNKIQLKNFTVCLFFFFILGWNMTLSLCVDPFIPCFIALNIFSLSGVIWMILQKKIHCVSFRQQQHKWIWTYWQCEVSLTCGIHRRKGSWPPLVCGDSARSSAELPHPRPNPLQMCPNPSHFNL